ncbi:MAG TPA: hypothetical protein DEA08_25375, partial [Planctomycetes bacterium]|nr:hypothetical protein [Planctomycetota bacterium]
EPVAAARAASSRRPRLLLAAALIAILAAGAASALALRPLDGEPGDPAPVTPLASLSPVAAGPPGFPQLPARPSAAGVSPGATAGRLRAALAELRLPAWALLEREAALAPPGVDPAALLALADRSPPASREHLAPLARAARLGWSPAIRRLALGILDGELRAIPVADDALAWRLLTLLLAFDSQEALPALAAALETDPQGRSVVTSLQDRSLSRTRRELLGRELGALLAERWALEPRPHTDRRMPLALDTPERRRRACLLLERVAALGKPWEGAVKAAAYMSPHEMLPHVPPNAPYVGTTRWLQLAGRIVKVTQTLGEVRGFRLLASFGLIPPGSPELELQRRCLMHENFTEVADIQALVVAGLSWVSDESIPPARGRELALATFRISLDISEGATDRVRRALFTLKLSGDEIDEGEVRRFPLELAWRLYWSAAESDLVALGWAEPLPE